MEKVIEKNKEVISYLVFGVLTTLVNIISYGLLTKICGMDYKLATTVSWVLAVIFAFVTNKIIVFNSRNYRFKVILKEFSTFAFFRLLSLGVDIVIMIIMVERLAINDLFAKVFANIIVVALNYIASKVFIFKKEKAK
jgi:putative flippase GtrA